MAATTNTNVARKNWPNGYAVGMAKFNRPADVIAYSTGDQVSDNAAAANYLSFPEVAAASGLILGATLTLATPAAADFDLYLFDAIPTGLANDNAAAALVAADMENCIGFISFKTAQKATAGIDVFHGVDFSNTNYMPQAYYGAVYGVLVIRTAVALGSANTICIRLFADRSDLTA